MTKKPLDLEAIEQRAQKATPPPWRRFAATRRAGFRWGENEIAADDVCVVAWNGFDSADGTKAQKRANAQFIAHARKDVLALIAEVERLRSLVATVGVSEAAIQAGVVTLMRDTCMAVLQAHRESKGLDILDERIRAEEDNLARIAALLESS